MRILTAQDIRAAVDMPAAIAAVREGFIALSTGRATVPVRGALDTPKNIVLTMPAYMQGAPVHAVKVVCVAPDNPQRNLPAVIGTVLVLDAETADLLAVLDGTALTALRTGAASGLATDLLAQQDAKTLGVIGAGAQARTQIEAVCAVRPVEEIRLFALSGMEKLAEELRQRYAAQVVLADDRHQALSGVDIIVAATNSKTPVVYERDVAPGAHINGIGSFTPDMQEIAPAVVARAKVVVGHRASAWVEAGDLIIAREEGFITEAAIHAEIGEIAAGLRPGRESDDEITFFKSVGNAVQDLAVAARVVAIAQERGLGTEIDL